MGGQQFTGSPQLQILKITSQKIRPETAIEIPVHITPSQGTGLGIADHAATAES